MSQKTGRMSIERASLSQAWLFWRTPSYEIWLSLHILIPYSRYVTIINNVAELHEKITAILQYKLDSFTEVLRERLEGDPMPFDLTDDEAWEWYKRYVSEDDAEH
jgi:hypothetical protein